MADKGKKLDRQRLGFSMAFQTALRGAAAIAQRHEQLAPHLFLVTRSGELQIVAWTDERQMRNCPDEVRALVQENRAVAAVTVAEATAVKDDFSRAVDIAMIYGTFPGTMERKLITFEIIDGQFKPCEARVEEKMVVWLDEALEAR